MSDVESTISELQKQDAAYGRRVWQLSEQIKKVKAQQKRIRAALKALNGKPGKASNQPDTKAAESLPSAKEDHLGIEKCLDIEGGETNATQERA